MLTTIRSRLLLGLAASAGLSLIALAYYPGLSGPFIFDDFGNLNVLGAFGDVWRWPQFLYYLTSGGADPTGRPIALLTFLIDGSDWPTDPWPFKRTNLLLHLVNTALLAQTTAVLQSALCRAQPGSSTAPWAPLFAALLWGAHPFFVSTTLYVVQREAMLPLAFILLAILAWTRVVRSFEMGSAGRAWAWALLGFGGATILGGMSKANGFLAPLLAGLVHLYFLRPATPPSSSTRRQVDIAAALCLAIPSAMILFYLLYSGWQAWSLPLLTGREWTLPERLLSQPRALWDYLLRLVIPRSGGGGVFVEGFTASRSWTDPATTLPAFLALLACTVAAVVARHRFPRMSFAWLFFLAAHLLESSTIALELYFEHRNYVPAAFLGWPLANALLSNAGQERGKLILATIIVALLLGLTHLRASTWGDPALLAAVQAAHESESPRAQVSAAHAELERGETQSALDRMQRLLDAHGESVDITINAIGLECQATGKLAPTTLDRTKRALSTAPHWNYGLYVWFRDAAQRRSLIDCEGFGMAPLYALIENAEANQQSKIPHVKRDLWHVRGQIALLEGDGEKALHWFDAALGLAPEAQYALVQAADLGNAGYPELGGEHLDRFRELETSMPPTLIRDMPSLHRWLLRNYGYYRTELADLRERLRADAASPQSPENPN